MTTRTRLFGGGHIVVTRWTRKRALVLALAFRRVNVAAFSVMVVLGALLAASSPARAQSAIAKKAFASDLGVHRASENGALTLAALLDSVAIRHPLVAASRARVRAAEGARETAGVFNNPVVGFEVDNTPFPWHRSITLPLGMERESMITATIPLEPLYQRSPRIRQADAEVRAARADAVGERQRVASDAARAFYRTALAQVAVEVAVDLASWLDTLVSYNAKRVGQGAVAEADLIRSQLERDRALAEQAIEEAELARARAQLSSFLGAAGNAEPSTPFRIVVSAGAAPLPLSLAERDRMSTEAPQVGGVRSDTGPSRDAGSGSQRPDVLAARERVTASRAAITSERTMLFRELGATFGVKRSAGTSTMIAGVSLPVPLFDQNRGQVARAQAEREVAAFDLADKERTASAEVSGAREAARLLTDRALQLTGTTNANARGRATSFLTRADEARRIALGAYREGAVPLIQVLDAARAWGEARRAYYQTLYEQHESVLELLTAEGIDLHEALSGSTPHTSSPPSP